MRCFVSTRVSSGKASDRALKGERLARCICCPAHTRTEPCGHSSAWQPFEVHAPRTGADSVAGVPAWRRRLPAQPHRHARPCWCAPRRCKDAWSDTHRCVPAQTHSEHLADRQAEPDVDVQCLASKAQISVCCSCRACDGLLFCPARLPAAFFASLSPCCMCAGARRRFLP